jgi:hypothetical protein
MNPFFRHEPQGVVTQQSSMLDTSYTALDSISRAFIGIAMRRHQCASLNDSA